MSRTLRLPPAPQRAPAWGAFVGRVARLSLFTFGLATAFLACGRRTDAVREEIIAEPHASPLPGEEPARPALAAPPTVAAPELRPSEGDDEGRPRYSEHCAPGMREVDGEYCTALLQHCLKPRNLEGKPTESPNYYLCDEI